MREIGRALKRNPSSVSREVKRTRKGCIYNPHNAHIHARVKRADAKYQGMKVKHHPELKAYIAENLARGWSPDVIAGCWNNDHREITITAKGIYKFLYSAHGQYLCKYLKSRQYGRRRRKEKKGKKILIPERISIDERPQVINERKRYGDFEADTMGVPKYTHATIAAAIERKSRYILARKIMKLKYAMDAFNQMLSSVPALSLTMDNGVENVRYQKLGIPTYFCHPYSSWEKGSIEYAFRMIRRYIPKKSDVSNYSEQEIIAIVEHINSIPRKILNYRSPKEVFEEQFLQANQSKCCTSG